MSLTKKRAILFFTSIISCIVSTIFNFFIEKEPVISTLFVLIGLITFIITVVLDKAKGNVLKNKMLWTFGSLITIVMLYGVYTENYFGGVHHITYWILAVLLIVDLFLYAYFFYKNPDSDKYKYIMLLIFELQFVIGTLTVESPWIMYIPLPVFVFYLLYKDTKILSMASFVVFVFNIVASWQFINRIEVMKDKNYGVYSYYIQIILFILFTLAICSTLNINNEINKEKLREIEDINHKSEELSRKLLKIAQKARNNAITTNSIIEVLETETRKSLEVLKNIVKRNDFKIKCVENQTEMTANISKMIEEVTVESDLAAELSDESIDGLHRGKVAFDKLKNKSNIIVNKNQQVIDIINKFVQNANKVKSITQGIAEISEQTNLLSLNASIESARASFASKDFGIVASEIRGLADNTSDLTDSIDKIVNSLENNAIKAQRLVNNVVEAINKENSTIDETLKEIVDMEDSIRMLSVNVNNVLDKIVKMSNFNIEIVNNITKLMASSEEVTSYIDEAIRLNNDNIIQVGQTRILMNELLEISDQVDVL